MVPAQFQALRRTWGKGNSAPSKYLGGLWSMRSQSSSCPSGLRVPTVVDGVGGGLSSTCRHTVGARKAFWPPVSSHLPVPAPVLTSRRLPLLRGMLPSRVLKGLGNGMAPATHWRQWRSEEDYGAAELREPERERWGNEQAAPGLSTFLPLVAVVNKGNCINSSHF